MPEPTLTTQTDNLPPTPPSTPPEPLPSRFHCLQVRHLYEKCGHIEILTIHEMPCLKIYRGWLPETSPHVQTEPCRTMTRYVTLKHAECDRCQVSEQPVKRGGLFGWGKVVERKEKSDPLPIREIVARREEWLRGMEAQKHRRRRREEK